jgi:hypothetical protein
MTYIEERAGILAENLEEINGLLVELTAVFRVKRQVLARADMESLAELLAREEVVTEKLFDAETRREVLVEEMSAATGTGSFKLVDISERLPKGAAEVLIEAGLQLRMTMDVLVREASIVAEVCRAASEHYDKLIKIITGANLAPATYTAAGPAKAAGGRNIIDQAI